MPNSLKTILSKLRYKRQITNEEYQELITKLDGHDKVIRADERNSTIDKVLEEVEFEKSGYLRLFVKIKAIITTT